MSKKQLFERWDRIYQKGYHNVGDVIRTRETSIILNLTFWFKAIDKEAAPILL